MCWYFDVFVVALAREFWVYCSSCKSVLVKPITSEKCLLDTCIHAHGLIVELLLFLGLNLQPLSCSQNCLTRLHRYLSQQSTQMNKYNIPIKTYAYYEIHLIQILLWLVRFHYLHINSQHIQCPRLRKLLVQTLTSNSKNSVNKLSIMVSHLPTMMLPWFPGELSFLAISIQHRFASFPFLSTGNHFSFRWYLAAKNDTELIACGNEMANSRSQTGRCYDQSWDPKQTAN